MNINRTKIGKGFLTRPSKSELKKEKKNDLLWIKMLVGKYKSNTSLIIYSIGISTENCYVYDYTNKYKYIRII